LSRDSRRKVSRQFPIRREFAHQAEKPQRAYSNRALESNTEIEESQQKKAPERPFFRRARCIAADPKNIGDVFRKQTTMVSCPLTEAWKQGAL
jgi:hypothetical protein